MSPSQLVTVSALHGCHSTELAAETEFGWRGVRKLEPSVQFSPAHALLKTTAVTAGGVCKVPHTSSNFQLSTGIVALLFVCSGLLELRVGWFPRRLCNLFSWTGNDPSVCVPTLPTAPQRLSMKQFNNLTCCITASTPFLESASTPVV